MHRKDIKNSKGISGCEHIKLIFENHGKSIKTKQLRKIKSTPIDTLREKLWIKTEASAAMSNPRAKLNPQQPQSALFISLLCSVYSLHTVWFPNL